MRKVLFIFGELNDLDIDWMMSAGEKKSVPKGEALIHEGKPATALYIILDGSFKVTIAAIKGAEIARLVAGEIAGEMSFVESRPPSATVTALEDSTVLSILRTELAAKLKQDPGFAGRFYKALSVFLSFRLRTTMNQLAVSKGGHANVDDADELDGNVLDNVYLAGARFDRMLKKMLRD